MSDTIEKSKASRRQFLKGAAIAGGGMFTLRSAFGEMCGVTPAQTPGPFYPQAFKTDDSINDLSIIDGHAKTAKGEIVYITGTVQDGDCRPVAGALVEIWQAAASGRYDHPADDSGLEVDPDFQGWGEFLTDNDGRFAFKTVVPGHYPADEHWLRAPHIHYKVTKRGFHEVVTQMYFTPTSFTGEKAKLVAKLNDEDLILREVPGKERVIVEFTKATKAVTVGPLLAYRKQSGAVKLVEVGMLTAAAGEKLGNFPLFIRSAR